MWTLRLIRFGKKVASRINPTHIFIILILLRFLDIGTAYIHYRVNPEGFELREQNPDMVAATKGNIEPLLSNEAVVWALFAFLCLLIFLAKRKGLSIKFELIKRGPSNKINYLKLNVFASALVGSPLILFFLLLFGYRSLWGTSTNIMAYPSLSGVSFLIACYALAFVLALGITYVLLRHLSLSRKRLIGSVLLLLTLAVLWSKWDNSNILWWVFVVSAICVSGILILSGGGRGQENGLKRKKSELF